MTNDRGKVLWTQFILARALVRSARQRLSSPHGRFAPYCFTDTHADLGRFFMPPDGMDRVIQRRNDFKNQEFFTALEPSLSKGGFPGVWVLASRLLYPFEDDEVEVGIDVNNRDAKLIAHATAYREQVRTRFWSHDWSQFLRSRLTMTEAPGFVFINRPPDDDGGAIDAIDAALLLETLGVPYMVSYISNDPQEMVEQVGQTGLELSHDGDLVAGVLLGAGAEGAMLDLLPDLRLLAASLGGEFSPRFPSEAHSVAS